MVVDCLERRSSYSVTSFSSEVLRLSYARSHSNEGIGDVEAAAAVGVDDCAAAWGSTPELLGDSDAFDEATDTTTGAAVVCVCDGFDDLWRTTKAESSCPSRLLLLLLLLPKMVFRRCLTSIAMPSYVQVIDKGLDDSPKIT